MPSHWRPARPLNDALEINRGIGDRRGQADVLISLAITRYMANDFPAAASVSACRLRDSREILRRIGTAETGGVSAELHALSDPRE